MNSFELFWSEYDKKVSRDKAEKKWHSLSATNQGLIMLHIPKYKLKQPDRQFRKDPITYLNQKTWLDEVYGEKEEEEEKRFYTEPKETTVSKYKVKPFDRAEGIAHLRAKLKSNYEKGSFIKDWGGVYTALLIDKCSFIIPLEDEKKIIAKVYQEATRKRNRFEEQYTGNVESDIRDGCLNWFLDKCREEQRDLSLEI